MRIMYTLLIIGVCCMPVRALASDKLSLSELLDRYATNQDKLRSVIAKTEETIMNIRSNKPTPEFTRWVSELRFDGKRTHHSLYRWLNLPAENAPTPPIEDAYYHLQLWDGRRYTEYGKSMKTSFGKAYISRNEKHMKSAIVTGYYAAPFLGIRYSNYERIDSVLRQADSISIRDELEQVSSVACYVINAKTRSGTYTVWIDPEHGYNIAKADVRLEANDSYCGRQLRNNESRSLSVRNVRFENVDGAWVPMEADLYRISKKQNGVTVQTTIHHKITQITLDTNHDLLGSFIPQIEDGTTVHDLDSYISYTWQDGELVPRIDECVIDEIDKMAMEIMTEGQVPAGLEAAKKTEAAPNQPAGIAETQVTTKEAQGEILSESRPFPKLVFVLIGLSIIAIIAWRVFLLKGR